MIKIQKYLPEQYLIGLKLKSFWVGSIKKQETSRAIEMLKANDIVLNEYSYLKRIRKTNNDGDFIDLLLCCEDQVQEREKITNIFGEMIAKYWKEDLPASNPCMKEQFLQWSKIWPINFIEQEIYKETKHSKQQLLFLHKISSSNRKEIVLFDENLQVLMIKNLDSQCLEGTIQHEVMLMLEQWPNTKEFQELPSAYYLTKLRIYCSHQICEMCSMALVHSRLERIYFPEEADIRTISQIVCCSKLNHRIKIFKVHVNPQNK